MAELADAHGSGPCESNFMEVRLLLPAPQTGRLMLSGFLVSQVKKRGVEYVFPGRYPENRNTTVRMGQ